MSKGEQFLHKKYSDLHTSKPVEHEQERRKIVGQEISHKPAEKIASFLQVLERTHGHHEDPRVLERIKNYYHKQYVIKPEEIPESAYLLEQKIARQMGYGDIEITDEFKERKNQQIIGSQTKSLDKWIDYLTSRDADSYPTWGKYWAFRSMVEMGKFEKQEDENGKERGRFTKRTKDTIASFPPLNPRALALTISTISSYIENKSRPKSERERLENKSIKLNEDEFKNLLSTENFSKIYTQFLIELPEYSTEGLKETRGKWVKYDQGSEPDELCQSLEGYPLEWCTAGIDVARDQLQGGDFYVYYSINESGEAVIPRLAIRMEGDDKIAEDPRGIAPDQNLDPYIGDVLEEKLNEFPDKEAYKKKSADMKYLTAIEEKVQQSIELNKQELTFLYEINSKISYFGYHKDPRIAEIISQRNPEEDILIVFECTPDQIAHTPAEINENTKAYLGKLEPGIFQLTQKYGIEHIYTKFPEGKIQEYDIKIGGKSKDQLKQELENRKDVWFGDWAKDLVSKEEFTTSQEIKDLNLVRLTVAEMGFPNGATTDEIYKRADELGLDFCPAEVGPQLRLQSDIKEWTLIGMKQITGSRGFPLVFNLDSDGAWLFLDTYNAGPDRRWHSAHHWVFSIRKLES